MSSGSKKGTQICYPFPSKNTGKRIPSRFPTGGPYGERYPLTGHFYISLNISLFIFPSESPVREPPPCSLTGYPLAAILRHQSHWSSFHSFIHSCTSAGVPKKEPSYIHTGKNQRSPSTEPHVDRRPTYNGVRSGSPRGSLMTQLSLPQCHAAFGTIPTTLVWVDQSPVSQHASGNPHQGVPSTTVTTSHVTQGRAEYKSTIP